MLLLELDVAGLTEAATIGKIQPLAGQVMSELRIDRHVLHVHSCHARLSLLVIRELRSSQG